MEYEIEKEFDKIIDKAVKDKSLKNLLESEVCGQDNLDANLFNEYKFDCERWLENLEIETGMKPGEMFPNWGDSVNSEKNKRIVVNEMFRWYYCEMEKMLLTLEKINEL